MCLNKCLYQVSPVVRNESLLVATPQSLYFNMNIGSYGPKDTQITFHVTVSKISITYSNLLWHSKPEQLNYSTMTNQKYLNLANSNYKTKTYTSCWYVYPVILCFFILLMPERKSIHIQILVYKLYSIHVHLLLKTTYIVPQAWGHKSFYTDFSFNQIIFLDYNQDSKCYHFFSLDSMSIKCQ